MIYTCFFIKLLSRTLGKLPPELGNWSGHERISSQLPSPLTVECGENDAPMLSPVSWFSVVVNTLRQSMCCFGVGAVSGQTGQQVSI